jgi:hydroxymethylbilane synthase
MKKIRIGTRGSRLALVQSEQVRGILLEQHPDVDFEIVAIKTTGDKILDAPLSKIGDKGLFTKEIEKELLEGTVDLAVHSMKDMPTELPSGLKIGAITKRLNPGDVFISRNGKFMRDLKPGDTIATGSLRRKAQVLSFMPHLTIIDIRGNVQSRLKKMRENPEIEGIILAHAGLERLGITELATEAVPENIILPAVGQASLAIEIRESDTAIESVVAALNDADSNAAISCERAFLSELGGGCQVPIACLARVRGGTIELTGMVASLDGKSIFRSSASGPVPEGETIARDLARKLLDEGARKILEQIYGRAL